MITDEDTLSQVRIDLVISLKFWLSVYVLRAKGQSVYRILGGGCWGREKAGLC